MNFTSNSIVAGTESTKTQAMNQPEDIAIVATFLPIQPINIKTLYSNKPRSFNLEWFKLYQYSAKQDAYFCFPCRMFGSNGGVCLRKHLQS